MAVQLQLTNIKTGKAVALPEIDRLMRVAVGAPEHDTDWLQEWYLAFGLALAVGKDWDYIRNNYVHMDDSHDDSELADYEQCLDMLDHLETTYENTSYGCR